MRIKETKPNIANCVRIATHTSCSCVSESFSNETSGWNIEENGCTFRATETNDKRIHIYCGFRMTIFPLVIAKINQSMVLTGRNCYDRNIILTWQNYILIIIFLVQIKPFKMWKGKSTSSKFAREKIKMK